MVKEEILKEIHEKVPLERSYSPKEIREIVLRELDKKKRQTARKKIQVI